MLSEGLPAPVLQRWAPVRLAANGKHTANGQPALSADMASSSKSLAWTNKTKDRGQSDYGDVASGFPMEGTMRAPMPTPEGLPARAAIIIMGCLFVFLSALWLFVITKAMIAIGVGAVALFTAGACAYAHRYALKPQ